ncbi:hypothetical protein [Robiginitalea sp. SC105]|uniref:hypothetical protein n=1 Tax=Robiginitalea sp. SC105 TaxID=2762332 RepID=UPI00163A77BD|nr:hypothetical protein [Robiginitalea sp. SC105]MBC2838122.1 hypothetical protein [Robiginitalea sp. SC105]
MSHSEKLYFARLGSALLLIAIATVTLMYYEQISEMILRESTERLASSLNALDASVANR